MAKGNAAWDSVLKTFLVISELSQEKPITYKEIGEIVSLGETTVKNCVKTICSTDFGEFEIARDKITSPPAEGMRWNPQRKLEVQKAGKLYQVSPYGISLSEDNYYLIAYDSAADCLKHYRIDKMQAIRMTEESREGNALFESFDIVDYSRKTFSMFGGREEVVNMECPNRLVGVFIDRFGGSAAIRPSFEKTDYSIIRVAVNVSPQFFAWLFGLGQQVKLLSPDSVIAEYQKMLSEISANYD